MCGICVLYWFNKNGEMVGEILGGKNIGRKIICSTVRSLLRKMNIKNSNNGCM